MPPAFYPSGPVRAIFRGALLTSTPSNVCIKADFVANTIGLRNMNRLAPALALCLVLPGGAFSSTFCAREYQPWQVTAYQACLASCALFATYVQSVAGACVTAANDDSLRPNVLEARRILVAHGFFSEGDFSGVTIRFCSLLGQAHGMVPRRDMIIIDRGLGDMSGRALAPLLGHEMVHVLQYRRYGREGFQCRYGREIFRHGIVWGVSRDRNPLEKEAYDLEDRITEALLPRGPDPDTCILAGTTENCARNEQIDYPRNPEGNTDPTYVMMARSLVLLNLRAQASEASERLGQIRPGECFWVQPSGCQTMSEAGWCPAYHNGVWGMVGKFATYKGRDVVLHQNGC